MSNNPVSKSSNLNSNSSKEQDTFLENHTTKSNKPNEIEYGLLDDKMVLPGDFAEFDLEIEKLLYGEV